MNTGLNKVVEQLTATQEAIAAKLNSEGYVVAGFGGDTFYAYVGKGKGYEGAELAPKSISPVVFESGYLANQVIYGTYKNGRGDVIRLKAMEASKYFAKLHEDITELIAQVSEQVK